MTNRKETKPRPSHPRRRLKRFGMKIKRVIDKTNKIISRVNRYSNFSVFIYDEENIRTAVKIEVTILQKRALCGSSMTLIRRWKEGVLIKFQSIIRVVEVLIVNMATKNKAKVIGSDIMGASTERGGVACFIRVCLISKLIQKGIVIQRQQSVSIRRLLHSQSGGY